MRKGLAVVSMLLVFVMLFAVGCTGSSRTCKKRRK
jgi:hypothetical protein